MRAALTAKEPKKMPRQRYIVAAYDDRAPRIRFFVVLASTATDAINAVNTRRLYRHMEAVAEREWLELTQKPFADIETT
jgi:hypothetical protein